ncbi:DUF979 domain-containing protein [Anaerorhabdus sp.]|uniref:DUF979 domain-containing protein n=1 Tax=Anaerorhabdus sp. TaxID=1872524 RepID=UPI002FC6B243
MEFFLSAEVTTSTKLLEVLYIIIGLVAIYAGLKNLSDKGNPARVGTAVFWVCLGVACSLGRFLPAPVIGVLVFVMCIPAVLQRVKPGSSKAPTTEEMVGNYQKIGSKIFIPALSMGVFALLFGVAGLLFPKSFTLSALIGTGLGVLFSIIFLMLKNKQNKPLTFLNDAERFLSITGPLCMLPTLLSILGSVFTTAGVGQTISSIVGTVIPEGNLVIGVIVYAIGMMLFTMIMGNAFAAITVLTVGIGAPFILAYGANPVAVGMLALTCGFCGTLCTPMAANFNIIPVAILEMKDKFGVIKNQIVPALFMIVFQIIMMLILM